MKGIVLAGGSGTRLRPLTTVTNKHLLPIGGVPMIQHCVEKLVAAGVEDVLVVTGGGHIGHIAEFLGSGHGFGCGVTYRVQDEAGGIAQALGLAEGFVRPGERMVVVLGDNIFEDDLAGHAEWFATDGRSECQAMVMLKRVDEPERFGVAEVEAHTMRLLGIDEKPKEPKSPYAVTGVYFYASTVFDVIRTLTPSARNELEITDVNNAYIEDGQMSYRILGGWWTDAGTHGSYWLANRLVRGEAGPPKPEGAFGTRRGRG